ncbi:hypothetical protein ALC62_12266 [Cyphomyrmex costatus]|uniref:Uncharacterized protein n=1 Tax=Cyphomyrmex costatus TaxID=456900 RepID=A0A151IC23_9HYME|nr:hypothetical protein ALC62_12266 [Cyphomyrmex costatus]
MNRKKIPREKQTYANRKNKPKKRKQIFNPKTSESNEASFSSTSAKKLKSREEIEVPVNSNVQYAIIDFLLVFSTLSTFVHLGFKIMLECENCNPRYILSSERIGQAYAINRRFIFIMRILGLGLVGCDKFCGLITVYLLLRDVRRPKSNCRL